jgi:hypothetical protein
MALGAVVFGVIAANSPAAFLGHFTVFALAVIVASTSSPTSRTHCTPR